VADDAPATVGELRTLKRWLIVAGVWAVAASAIAIIALLAAADNEQRRPAAVTNSQLRGVQRDLDERIDEVERRLEELPQSDDLSKLEGRLKTAEDRVGAARDDARALRTDVDDLQQKVDDLERQQQGNAGGTQTEP
jgi:septal ring factor EnvC (AmiA/AmiB activator)